MALPQLCHPHQARGAAGNAEHGAGDGKFHFFWIPSTLQGPTNSPSLGEDRSRGNPGSGDKATPKEPCSSLVSVQRGMNGTIWGRSSLAGEHHPKGWPGEGSVPFSPSLSPRSVPCLSNLPWSCLNMSQARLDMGFGAAWASGSCPCRARGGMG